MAASPISDYPYNAGSVWRGSILAELIKMPGLKGRGGEGFDPGEALRAEPVAESGAELEFKFTLPGMILQSVFALELGAGVGSQDQHVGEKTFPHRQFWFEKDGVQAVAITGTVNVCSWDHLAIAVIAGAYIGGILTNIDHCK